TRYERAAVSDPGPRSRTHRSEWTAGSSVRPECQRRELRVEWRRRRHGIPLATCRYSRRREVLPELHRNVHEHGAVRRVPFLARLPRRSAPLSWPLDAITREEGQEPDRVDSD